VSGGGDFLVLTKRIAVSANEIVLGNIDDISCTTTSQLGARLTCQLLSLLKTC